MQLINTGIKSRVDLATAWQVGPRSYGSLHAAPWGLVSFLLALGDLEAGILGHQPRLQSSLLWILVGAGRTCSWSPGHPRSLGIKVWSETRPMPKPGIFLEHFLAIRWLGGWMFPLCLPQTLRRTLPAQLNLEPCESLNATLKLATNSAGKHIVGIYSLCI